VPAAAVGRRDSVRQDAGCRRSEYVYTDRTDQAMPGEPEAVDVVTADSDAMLFRLEHVVQLVPALRRDQVLENDEAELIHRAAAGGRGAAQDGIAAAGRQRDAASDVRRRRVAAAGERDSGRERSLAPRARAQ